MMNTAVTYSGWNEATLTGLAFSAGWYMNLVRSVTVNVCLADDDVSLRRGVTKTKMPRTEVKHDWLSPSVDAFLRTPKDTKRPSDFRGQQRVVPGEVLRDNDCQMRHARMAVRGAHPANENDL